MQKINSQVLIEKAISMLGEGKVKYVLGWTKGQFGYDVTPTFFEDENQIKENFVYNDFCGANLSKYLVNKLKNIDGKVLVFLKPCDTYSFNQLLTEHRIDKEKIYAVGIPCEGMLDVNMIKEQVDSTVVKSYAFDAVSKVNDSDFVIKYYSLSNKINI